jgi:hypothetical protein
LYYERIKIARRGARKEEDGGEGRDVFSVDFYKS